jgi:uncharacterized membrane protein
VFWKQHYLAVLLLLLAVPARADGPASKFRVISPRENDIEATGINQRGDITGYEWVEEAQQPGVLTQRPFVSIGKEFLELPLLKGYTTTAPAAISDGDRVVGRVGKPAPPGVRVMLRNQAFVWDRDLGIRGLGALPGDWASFATGISRNGRRISGYSIGDNRSRACFWNQNPNGDGWTSQALPQESQLGSTVVAISGDGKQIAAVDGTVTCLWSEGDNGTWSRTEIAAAGDTFPLMPRAVNDAGMVVGFKHAYNGSNTAAVWTKAAGLVILPKLAGYEKSEGLAVNNQGVVVGLIDGPSGSQLGPNAFILEGGALRLLTEGGPNLAFATGINDRGEIVGVFETPEGEGPRLPSIAPIPVAFPKAQPAQ